MAKKTNRDDVRHWNKMGKVAMKVSGGTRPLAEILASYEPIGLFVGRPGYMQLYLRDEALRPEVDDKQ